MKRKIIRVSTVPISLYLLLEGQLRYLDEEFEVIGVSSSGEYLDKVKDREGINVHAIEIKRKISPLNDITSLYNLYRFFKEQKPDIVHSITPKAGLLSMIAAKLAGVPYRLHTFTGLIFPSKLGLIKKILIFMDKILCKCATHIYPEGLGVKQNLIKYNITRKPLTIIANGNVNGVNTNFFSKEHYSANDISILREKYKILDDDFVFVFVGRLVKDKGINELVEAFSILNKNRSNLKLILIGNFEDDLDPLKGETMAEIEDNDNIVYVGFQSDIRPFLQMSNVFTFPSYREGFPNVVLQACSMGLPCIVTDIDGSNEIIKDGVNGIIIQPQSGEQLRICMEEVLSNKYNLKLMGVKARQKVKADFERRFVWDCLLDEYRKLN